jgi:two-component system alkaline phosphatase synthesis response regulator PhoP
MWVTALITFIVLITFYLNLDSQIKETKKESLTQAEIFKLVLSVTKDNEVKVIECGIIKLDRNGRTVSVKGKKTRLEKLSFNLLAYLMERQGETVPREILMRDVWGEEVCVTTRTIDVCVCKLRQIIGSERILTIKKVGYSFVNVK